MTLSEAIVRLDAEKHNTCTRAQKVAWISQLDTMVKTQIQDAYPDAGAICTAEYTDTTSGDLVLLVAAPFDEMYLRWLEARIDYASGEYDRYNNAMAMFDALWQAYRNHYNANHIHRQSKFRYL